jgi:hypothetical protein
MTNALLKGANGTSKRERGHRLQPEAPKSLTQSSAKPDYLTCIAGSLPRQEENTFPVRPTLDAATREITNAGHLAKAIVGIHALKKLRYGRKRVPVDAARDLYRVLAAVEAATAARNSRFVPDLHDWSVRHLCLSDAAKAEIRDELGEDAFIITPQFLGEQLGLTNAERNDTEFWDAEVAGITPEAREERKRARDRERKRAKRARSRKGKAFALALARARQLYPNVSQATLYRRAHELEGASHV